MGCGCGSRSPVEGRDRVRAAAVAGTASVEWTNALHSRQPTAASRAAPLSSTCAGGAARREGARVLSAAAAPLAGDSLLLRLHLLLLLLSSRGKACTLRFPSCCLCFASFALLLLQSCA